MNNNVTDIWNELQKKFEERYGEDISKQLLRKSKAIKLEDESIYIIIVNKLMKTMLDGRSKQIEALLEEITGKKLKLVVESLEDNEDGSTEKVSNEVFEKNNIESQIFDSHLDKKFRFDNFVVGNNTRFSHAAAQQVAEKPGGDYNPLFIYGKPGLGKTHLIQAIGNKMLEKNQNAKVFYTTTEEFTNDLINAIRNKSTESLHQKYRKLDCLIIDDIQQLKDKERTQEEFFNTFNSLYNAHKQIVIASDRLPQEIETLQDRITSRLKNGFLGDIQEPDFETRLAILRIKLEERNMELTSECMNLIATSITSDIRVLESVCNNLHLYYNVGENITQELITSLITKHGATIKKEGVTFEELTDTVSNYFGISKEDLLSAKRSKKISEPRHILMYLAKKITAMSFTDIGKELGNRDHSTVMHGYEKIYKIVEKNISPTADNINIIMKKLGL